MSFNGNKYRNNFNKEHYDRINLMIPKGQKELLKEQATKQNIGVNTLINIAITNYLNTISKSETK